MKKSILSLTAMAMLFAFTSCSSDDVTAPELTVPAEALEEIDLGDEDAAMLGVTAEDKTDGDVTELIDIINLDNAGEVTLTYSVADDAGNKASKDRAATIKTDKLAGAYDISVSIDGGEPTVYDGVVQQSSTVYNKILISDIIDGNIGAICQGTGFTVESVSVDFGEGLGSATLTGTGTFKETNGVFSVETADITADFENELIPNWTITVTFVKQ